jgi:EpsD family peptidyl-prolyl cis-trans isomerase
VLAMLCLAAGCGNRGDAGVSQVAARVNGDEIYVSQLDPDARAVMPPSGETAKAAAQLLQRLIDQQLLMQKAIETKLDNDPQIAKAIDNSIKQILAKAYIEKVMAAATTGTPDEINAFYTANPALFERRRIYRFFELGVIAAPDKLEAVRKQAEGAKNLNQIADWLKTRDIAFSRIADSTKPSEQLPMDLLPRLSGMQDGQIAFILRSDRAAILQLAQSQHASLDLQQATPLIEKFLLNKKRLQLAEAEVKKLRDKAKIDYAGNFDPSKPAAAIPSNAALAVPAGER